MKETEIWKSVGVFRGVDYTNMYEASTLGRLRSLDRVIIYKNGKRYTHKGKIIIPYKNKNGYMQVCLCKNGTKVFGLHELIMNTFIPNPNPEIYTDINHIDEDKTNNRLDNLEWCTHKENVNHGTAIERHSQTQRDRFIPIVQLDFNGNIINVYYSTREINKTEIYNARTISNVINKQNYIYKDYFWIRLNEYNNLTQMELLELLNKKVSIKTINKTKKFEVTKKPVMQFSNDDKFIKEYPSVTNAAKEIGCTKQAIQQCISGKQKTCKGCKWKYK